MFRPQYTRKPFELFLIGPGNSGKRTLAAQLLKTKDVFYLIHTADKLPNKEIDHVDFVFILIDMTQPASLDLLKQILENINISYLASKTAIVVTKMDVPRLWQIEIESIQKMIGANMDLHIFYANLNNHIEKSRVCNQLSRLVQASTLQYKNLNLTLLKTIQVYDIDYEEEETEVPPVTVEDI